MYKENGETLIISIISIFQSVVDPNTFYSVYSW